MIRFTQALTLTQPTIMTFDTSYDPPHNTDAFDNNGKMIVFGDSLLLTFHKGTHREHSSEYDVVWYRGAFCIKSDSGKISPLQSIAESVEVIK